MNKTLGLLGCYHCDMLMYKITPPLQFPPISNIAQIFVPLSLLFLFVIKVKIFIQRIWSERIDWIQSGLLNIHFDQLLFKGQVTSLNPLKITRYLKSNVAVYIETHGFFNSSEQADGTCSYARSNNSSGKVTVNFVYEQGFSLNKSQYHDQNYVVL